MLDRLIQLSKDPSAAGRRELLHAVTDLFLVESAPNEAVKDHYASIAGGALDRIDVTERAAYAHRVAAESKLPRAVAQRLANDPVAEVAGMVLRLSPVLTDEDLASIAVTHSAQHMLAIAQRASLSETVTDILVQRGDRDVLRTVSGNDGARLSQNGVTGLLDRSGGDEQILEGLARRKHQLSPEQFKRLQKIADEFGAAPAGNGAQPRPFTPERRQAQERRLEVRLLIADIKRGERSVSDAVQLLADQDRAFDLAQVIGTLSELPSVQCLKALLDPDVTATVVACRALGVSAEAFKAVLQMRASRLGHAAAQIEREARSYADLSSEIAERTMRFLHVRSRVS